MPPSGKVQFNIWLPPDLAATLRSDAKGRRMKVSDFTENLLRIGYRHHKHREAKTVERLSAGDAALDDLAARPPEPMPGMTRCPDCGGIGLVEVGLTCDRCTGSGFVDD